jgi:hypothetical protein
VSIFQMTLLLAVVVVAVSLLGLLLDVLQSTRQQADRAEFLAVAARRSAGRRTRR